MSCVPQIRHSIPKVQVRWRNNISHQCFLLLAFYLVLSIRFNDCLLQHLNLDIIVLLFGKFIAIEYLRRLLNYLFTTCIKFLPYFVLSTFQKYRMKNGSNTSREVICHFYTATFKNWNRLCLLRRSIDSYFF